MTRSEAESAASLRQLKVYIAREVYHVNVEAGRVISQNPKAGSETKAGRTIRIVISRGSEMVRVPDLSGKTQVEAELILESRKLTLGNVYTEPNSDTPKGCIARQTPEPGSSVEKGSLIDLYVSLGPNVDTVKVPNFIGRQLNEVQAELAGLGLVFSTANPEVSAFPEGQILDQQPAPGSLVPVGTQMTFVVSSGTAVNPKPFKPYPQLAESQGVPRQILLDIFALLQSRPRRQEMGIAGYRWRKIAI
jgi:serine/threonine-protein kinase